MGTDRKTSITSSQIRKHTLQQDDISPDALVWQEPCLDKDLIAPPSSGNAEGDRYIVASTFSYDVLNEDCAAIDDWNVADTGNATTTQVTFDTKSCFKFDTNTATGAEISRIYTPGGIAYDGNHTVEINLYLDAVSATTNNSFELQSGSGHDGKRLNIYFRSDGLFIFDGSQYNEVGTNLVVQDQWQKWRFEVNIITNTVDIYLDDILKASDVAIGTEAGENELWLFCRGIDDSDRIAYVDYVKVGSGIQATWYEHENDIAQYINSSWSYYTPVEGWIAWVNDENKRYSFNGSSWVAEEAHTQNTDTDLDATFEATFVKKADTVNELSDITSAGADIEDAVTKKHTQNTDTDLDATFEDTFVKKVDNVNELADITSPGANIEDAVTHKDLTNNPHSVDIDDLGLASGTVAADVDDAIDKKHTQNTDTDLDSTFEATFVKKVDTVNELSDITSAGAEIEDAVTHKDLTNNPHAVGVDDLGLASGTVAADIDDAVTKKHAQNTDTALGAQSEALDMNTHKITGVVDPTTDQEAATKKYVDENGGGDTLPIVDTTGIAKGSGDATKIVRLEVDGITTETTRVLTVQDKDYTIADKAEVDKTKKTTLGITIDGGGIELTIGIKGYIAIPYNCTITGWVALADISGSIKIDVWKDVYANYPPTDADSITNGHEPEITTATKAEDSDLGDWSSVTVTAGDVIGFSVDSITDITRLTLILQVTKT